MSVLLDELRELVEGSGHSQQAIAASMGISQSYLSDILNGRRDITPALADSFAIVLSRGMPRPVYSAMKRRLHLRGAEVAGWQVQP